MSALRPNSKAHQRLKRLAVEAAVTGLATWFAIVAITGLPGIHLGQVRATDPAEQGVYTYDFAAFYSAGLLLRHGKGGDAYNLSRLQIAESRVLDLPSDQFQFLPFYNPPPALLLFAPLSLAGLQVASGIWLFGSLLLAGVGVYLLLRAYPVRLDAIPIACAVLAVVSSIPFYWAARFGQISFFLVFGVCLLYASMLKEKARYSVPGLLILSLKPQLLLLPVFLFLLQRRYRELTISAAVGAGLLLITAILAGPRSFFDYFQLVRASTSWDSQNGIYTSGMFGWVGFVGSATEGQASALRSGVVALLDAITLIAGAWAIRSGIQRHRHAAVLLSIAIVAGLLASPHFYAQDLLLLVPVLLVTISMSPNNAPLPIVVAIAGWFIAYAHFAVLGLIHINITTLYMLALLVWLVLRDAVEAPGRRRPPGAAGPPAAPPISGIAG